MTDGGLFSPVTPPHGRYAVRPPAREWPAADDLLVYPAAYYCPNEAAYLTTCMALCKILEREPAFPAGMKPTHADIVGESAALVELRSINRGMSGVRPAVIPLAWRVFGGFRTGAPVTWGEARLLRGYADKRDADKRIGRDDLRALLDRGTADAAADEYLDAGPPVAELPGRGPLVGREIAAAVMFTDWRARADRGLGDRTVHHPGNVRGGWRRLCEFLAGGG